MQVHLGCFWAGGLIFGWRVVLQQADRSSAGELFFSRRAVSCKERRFSAQNQEIRRFQE